MKSWLLKGIVAVAIVLPALSGAAWAGGDDDFGCSNATLKGEYAYGVTAYTPPGEPNGPPLVVLGIHYFDGKGTLLQQDYRGDTSPAQFAPLGQEKGTYKVNPDCTGSAVVYLNYPVPTDSTGVIKVLFVISNNGRHIHEVVSEFTPPGFSAPQPTQNQRRRSGRSRRSGTTEAFLCTGRNSP
jgi:hypothetical protein